MHTQPIERARHNARRIPVITPVTNNGILLALDGHCLERPALQFALQHCKRSGNRLDILLLNPPKPATLMLGQLLRELESEGIDYRLTSGEGDLAEELPLYLNRFKYIALVLLDCLDKWEIRLHSTLKALRQDGYTILSLLEHEHAMLA